MSPTRFLLTMVGLLFFPGCGGDDDLGPAGDGDADADGDSDGDADGDGDGDGDCVDDDGDGYRAQACGGDDCDDADLAVYPGADDAVGDGVDQGCDGADGVDTDRDAHASLASGGDDCDDDSATVHPGRPDETWALESIESDGDTGHSIRIALESDGTIHVAFSDWTAREIRTGRRAGGAWSIATAVVDGVGALDLAVEAPGVARLCYQDIDAGWSRSWLRCGDDAAGSFSSVLVDDAGWTALDPSLLVDTTGNVFVTYGSVGGAAHQLRGASDASGEWSSALVVETGGLGSSVAADSDGDLHAAFVGNDGSIHYATSSGGPWQDEVVAAGAAHEGPWLGIAGDGEIHVAYRHGGQEVWHATRSGGAWPNERVWQEPGASQPGGVSGAIAADGVVVLFFPMPGPGTIALGSASDAGGTWTAEPVEPGAVATSSDAAIHDGVVYAAYQSGLAADTDAHFAFRGVPDGVDNDCNGVEW